MAQVLADMEPMEVIYWRRVLKYFGDLHRSQEGSWARAAFNEMISMEDDSNYISRVKFMLNRLEVEGTKDLEKKLAKYSAELTNKELENVSSTCFVLGRVTAEKPTRRSIMFGYDSWAKIYHEFVTMNAGIGNRNALDGWPRLLLCPLCKDEDNGLNEIHVLLLCRKLAEQRSELGVEDFIERRSSMTVPELYFEYWRTAKSATLKNRIVAADRMREAFLGMLLALKA